MGGNMLPDTVLVAVSLQVDWTSWHGMRFEACTTRVNAAVKKRFAISILPKPFNLSATSWPRSTKATKTTKSLTGLTFLIAFWNSVFWSVFALPYLGNLSRFHLYKPRSRYFKSMEHILCAYNRTQQNQMKFVFFCNRVAVHFTFSYDWVELIFNITSSLCWE